MVFFKTQICNTEVFVFLDGNYLHFTDKPQIVNGTAMVPMRTIFEMFGCSVIWNEDEKSAAAVKNDGTVIKVQLGNTARSAGTIKKTFRQLFTVWTEEV